MRSLNDSELFDLKLALLEKHSTQHSGLRQKIHLTTERYVTIMLALAALVNANIVDFSTKGWLQIIACIIICFIMAAIVYMIIKDNRSSLRHAKIVNAINEEFGMFSKGKIINKIKLYPDKWKDWGNEPRIKGAILHISIVVVVTALVILSLFMGGSSTGSNT